MPHLQSLLFTIPLLYCSKRIMLFNTYNSYFKGDLAYYKTSVIEVANILIYSFIFCNYVLYKLKLYVA